tara:strand:- start:13825 stop:14214 length:390 start_codon:yes stop_codon:yes gene_type:complete
MGFLSKSFEGLRKFGTKSIGEMRKVGTKYGGQVSGVADFLQKNALPTVEKVGRAVSTGAKVAAPIISQLNPTAGKVVGLIGKGAGMAADAARKADRGITEGRQIVSNVKAGRLDAAMEGANRVKALTRR